MEGEELTQAGHRAEEMFVRHLRMRRQILGLTQAEVAERVAAQGGSLYQQTIAKIEAGQRAVRLSEADTLARALETTVPDMLSTEMADEKNRLSYHALMERRASMQKELARFHAEMVESQHAMEMATMRFHQAQQRTHELEEELAAATVTLHQAEHEQRERDKRRAALQATAWPALPPEREPQDPPVKTELFLESPSAGRALARARKRAGLTLEQVAKRVGVRVGTLQIVEHGDFWKLKERAYPLIRATAQAVGEDADSLIAGIDKDAKEEKKRRFREILSKDSNLRDHEELLARLDKMIDASGERR